MKDFPYKLVYFFGSDGTGKTTHADMISSYLAKRGLRIWRASIKQHHTLSFLFLKLFNAQKNNSAMNYYGFNGELALRIRTPWKILELISLGPALFSRVFLPSMLGFVVVCDRYLLDTLVTLSYFLKEPNLVSGKLAQLIVKLIPKKSFLVYFEADTKIILERKKDEPLTEQLIEYYKKSYRFLARNSGLKITLIDNSACSKTVVQAKLQSLMQSASMR